ncbi:MAG: transglutaminase-like cysteine peptidase [Rhizomicrobium sp.]
MDRFRGAATVLAALLLTACQSPGPALISLSDTASFAPTASSNPYSDVIRASTSMPSGPATAPPSGYVDFCNRDPEQCASAPGNLSSITLDANTWRTLEQVNTAWNTAIKPEEDAAHYGRVDYWTIPKDGYGDCEDYALGKRKSLVDLGIPVQALRLTIARTGDGTAHTVLVAATDRGDYVLDNLNSAILPWTAVNYTWIARQIPGQTQWAFIGPTRNLEREFASAGIRP